MANLKEIRNRISSIQSTMKITSAMKMVSAAKLKKAQDAITAMRPYSNKLTELLRDLSSGGNFGGVYSEQREVKKVLIVVVTSNRGLCGAFNSSIIKKTVTTIEEKYNEAEVDLLTIGKKGNEILSKNYTVFDNRNDVFDNLTFDTVSEIAVQLMDLFADKKYDKIELIYNQFKNAATQIAMVEQFLPIQSVQTSNENEEIDYILEPSKQEIVSQLVPKSLKVQLYKAIRDSFASEHGARMTAMHKATDNATDLRDDLKLSYNKARQAAITNEILEIVSGAEALNS
ncbi:MAG: ATP synthase F1 subunit gamma [Tenacibaculum sp.]|nr:ATP synthase F1 subunit gamma [Tenacibaculum sp.]